MINLPVTVTRASEGLASPGQVDLVSKPGSVVSPLSGEKLLLGLKAPTNPSPSWEGPRQPDTPAEPIWHSLEQLT